MCVEAWKPGALGTFGNGQASRDQMFMPGDRMKGLAEAIF